MSDFNIGQKVKANCFYGRDKKGEALLRKGVITYVHPEGRHVQVDFGPYSECIFPNEVVPLSTATTLKG